MVLAAALFLEANLEVAVAAEESNDGGGGLKRGAAATWAMGKERGAPPTGRGQ
jgi:hypothetical protein